MHLITKIQYMFSYYCRVRRGAIRIFPITIKILVEQCLIPIQNLGYFLHCFLWDEIRLLVDAGLVIQTRFLFDFLAQKNQINLSSMHTPLFNHTRPLLMMANERDYNRCFEEERLRFPKALARKDGKYVDIPEEPPRLPMRF